MNSWLARLFSVPKILVCLLFTRRLFGEKIASDSVCEDAAGSAGGVDASADFAGAVISTMFLLVAKNYKLIK